MKKAALSLVFGLFLAFTTSASISQFFTIDEVAISSAMQDLEALENFIMLHDGISQSELIASNLLKETSMASLVDNLGITEPPLGIPSFVFGCVLGWVGVLIVYLTTEDKEETKKALYGMLTQLGVGCLFYIAYFAIFIGLATAGGL